MLRACLYLGAAGVVWFVEGFLFSYFLRFSPGQVVLMVVFYAALFAMVMQRFRQSLNIASNDLHDFDTWKFISLAPMAVVVVGSFVSLPVLLLVVTLGKLA